MLPRESRRDAVDWTGVTFPFYFISTALDFVLAVLRHFQRKERADLLVEEQL